MIAANYNGTDIYVLDVAPEWGGGVSAEVSVVAEFTTGLNNREARRAYGRSLRWRTRYSIDVEGKDARRVAAGLRANTTEPVVIPFWPALTTWGARGASPLSAGLKIVFKADWSQWALYEGVEPGWPADGDCWAPVLWGRLEERKPQWATPGRFTLVVDHSEASPAAYATAPAAVVFATGPKPSLAYAAGPMVFPFAINFDARPEDFTLGILREQVGFAREAATTFYPQAVARESEGGHFFESAVEWGKFLEFFRQTGGGTSFWCPDWVSETELTADVGAADTVLQVTDTALVKVGDWLYLGTPEGAFATGLVAATTGTTVTLAAAVGADFGAAETVVSGMRLVRFRSTAVQVQWSSGEYAAARLQLRELPAEYVPSEEETLGTTLGGLGTRCYLYELSVTLEGNTYTERWTSFESASLAYGGHDYAQAKVSHGEIRQGLYLDLNAVELKADVGIGGKLVALATMKLEAPLMLVVMAAVTADGATATGAVVVFTGEVTKVSVKGNRLTAQASPAGSIFERQLPRFIFQSGCNHVLFSPGCALAKADWKFAAVMAVDAAGGYPFGYQLSGLAGVGASAVAALGGGAVGQDYFALGWVVFGAGAAIQRRAVLLSTAPVAGALTVTLDRDVLPLPAAGTAVAVYPGCDGSVGRCKGLGNYPNFGGHPLMPVANPSAVRPGQSNGGGKK